MSRILTEWERFCKKEKEKKFRKEVSIMIDEWERFCRDEKEKEIRAEERAKMLMPYDVESVEELVANVRSKTIDEVIKTLAQSVDTICSDRQYYELLKMKGGTEDEND